jgi:hypothetical protein
MEDIRRVAEDDEDSSLPTNHGILPAVISKSKCVPVVHEPEEPRGAREENSLSDFSSSIPLLPLFSTF